MYSNHGTRSLAVLSLCVALLLGSSCGRQGKKNGAGIKPVKQAVRENQPTPKPGGPQIPTHSPNATNGPLLLWQFKGFKANKKNGVLYGSAVINNNGVPLEVYSDSSNDTKLILDQRIYYVHQEIILSDFKQDVRPDGIVNTKIYFQFESIVEKAKEFVDMLSKDPTISREYAQQLQDALRGQWLDLLINKITLKPNSDPDPKNNPVSGSFEITNRESHYKFDISGPKDLFKIPIITCYIDDSLSGLMGKVFSVQVPGQYLYNKN